MAGSNLLEMSPRRSSGEQSNGPMKKNPLRHRYIRDLKEDAGKYLVIFLLMVLSISEVSGFLVAGESMIAAYNESFEKYHVEDGHFSTERKIRQGTRARIESLSVTLYPLFYAELRLDHVRPESAQAVQADPADAVSAEPEADFSPISLDGTSEVDNTLRIFEKRSDINLECLMDGRFPDEEGESL